MALSLTRDELFERLLEPQRMKLLWVALKEDASKALPLHTLTTNQDGQGEISIDMAEALKEIAQTSVFRAITLAYDETLD